MKAIFYLVFYMLIILYPVVAQDMKLEFRNDTDQAIVLKASVSHYSVFSETLRIDDEEEPLVGPNNFKHLELTVLSSSYFDHVRAKPENTDGNQNNRDRLCLEIDGEEFIVYWDQTPLSTWKPKVFKKETESSKYDIKMSSSKKTVFHFIFLIEDKTKTKPWELVE